MSSIFSGLRVSKRTLVKSGRTIALAGASAVLVATGLEVEKIPDPAVVAGLTVILEFAWRAVRGWKGSEPGV